MKSNVIFNPQPDLLTGVNIVADAVELTLGAKGQNVGIASQTPQGEIYERTVLDDGVRVAESIHLKDEAQNFGAQILIEAARKQRDMVGDGTSVTISLARAIIKQAQPIIAAGENPQTLKPDLESAIIRLTDNLKALSQKVTTQEELVKVATISAKDPVLGKLIGETIHKLGAEGVVTAEESKNPDTTVEHQAGMLLEHGWYHQFFATNPQGTEAHLDHPYLLVTDKPITSLRPLSVFLTEFVAKAKKLVIISPDVSGQALPFLIQNKLDNVFLPLAIKAPSFGYTQKETLRDIAALTGATFFTDDAGHEFEKLTMKDLGRCTSVTATRNGTIIVGGNGKKTDIAKRIEEIKAALKKPETEFEKKKLQERLGKLTSGIAVIHVGGHTEIEMKEKREQVIDGIHATQAALKDGIVPGGEIVYLTIRQGLNQNVLAEKILYKALEQPFRRLVENAGYDGGQMLERLQQPNAGINVQTGKMENLLRAGIIDPSAVPIHALQNALSVALAILTTKAIIIPDKEGKNG